jgi:hypothetical protein
MTYIQKSLSKNRRVFDAPPSNQQLPSLTQITVHIKIQMITQLKSGIKVERFVNTRKRKV